MFQPCPHGPARLLPTYLHGLLSNPPYILVKHCLRSPSTSFNLFPRSSYHVIYVFFMVCLWPLECKLHVGQNLDLSGTLRIPSAQQRAWRRTSRHPVNASGPSGCIRKVISAKVCKKLEQRLSAASGDDGSWGLAHQGGRGGAEGSRCQAGPGVTAPPCGVCCCLPIPVISPPCPRHHSALKRASFHSFLEGITTLLVRGGKTPRLIHFTVMSLLGKEQAGKYLLAGLSLAPAHKQDFPYHVYVQWPRESSPSLFTEPMREDREARGDPSARGHSRGSPHTRGSLRPATGS